MAEPAHVQSDDRELHPLDSLHLRGDEAEPHDGDHPLAQHLRGAAQLLLREDVDEDTQQSWDSQAAVHEAGEHRYSDVRRRFLRHRL